MHVCACTAPALHLPGLLVVGMPGRFGLTACPCYLVEHASVYLQVPAGEAHDGHVPDRTGQTRCLHMAEGLNDMPLPHESRPRAQT
jgi:hypothetical protein